MNIVIIGAGLAGLTCADRLVAEGHSVTVLDKGRGPGGRMSTRRVATALGEATFDHGAPWFHVQDMRFRRQVQAWYEAGLVAPWPADGHEAWVGVPGMNALVRDAAARHDVTFNCHVRGIARSASGWSVMSDTASHGPFDAVIVAIPMEQATAIVALHDLTLARIGSTIRAQPHWTGMFAFDRPLPAAADVLTNRGILQYAIRNSAKPGRSGPESWVVQADGRWSQRHLEASPEEVLPHLQAALAEALGSDLPPPLVAQAHRWRYACYAGSREEALWNARLQLGVCGDWLLGTCVEAAWLSGHAMAQQVLDHAAPEEQEPGQRALRG